MRKLSLLDKNAYLSIYVSESIVYSVLAYSHHDIDRHYVLHDKTVIDLERDDLDSPYFWEKYFEAFERERDWQLLTPRSSVGSFRQLISFVDEGVGVSNVHIKVWNHLPGIQKIVEAVRSVSPQIKIELVDQKKTTEKLGDFAERMGYGDALLLELDPLKFRYGRASKVIHRRTFKNIKMPVWQEKHARVSWDNKYALIDSARSNKFKAFLSSELPHNKLLNLWANYILSPTLVAAGEALKDLIRSYITVQLYSAYNDHKDVFKGFGTQSDRKSLLVITGFLPHQLDDKRLLLSILDGLQLRGSFDMWVDADGVLATLGDQYVKNLDADSYVVTGQQISFKPSRVYVPEIPGRAKESKVVFDGELYSTDTGLIPAYALTNQLVEYNVPDGVATLTGKFVKGAYVEGIPEEIQFVSGKSEGVLDKVFIDGRFKPAVYGPGAVNNREKIKEWLA